MIDFSKAEKVNDEAYIFRNYLSEELCERLYDESLNSDDFYAREDDNITIVRTPVHEDFKKAIDDLLEGSGFWADDNQYLHWMAPKNYRFYEHRDDANPDYTGRTKAWGGVAYLSDFKGGALYYPTNETEVHPNRRDVVIHTASIPHGTRIIESDERRTITFVIYEKDKL